MDELKKIKERMDKVTHLEWVSGNIKSEDVYWLIEQVEKLENHLRHWKKVAETEETRVRKLQELNRKLQKESEGYRSNWIKASDKAIELQKETERLDEERSHWKMKWRDLVQLDDEE